jgi:hypothetical protein
MLGSYFLSKNFRPELELFGSGLFGLGINQREMIHLSDVLVHSLHLAEIYNWFTEGFDTGDLQEAKALLEELSAVSCGC